MKYCPNCGAPVEEGHKFCASCGTKLPDAAPVVMPPEPVYTDDPALTQDPVLSASPVFEAPAPKEEKVPELTLEPDLWGLGASAAAAQPAPAPKPEAPAESVQAPGFAQAAEAAHDDNPLRDEKEQTNELPHDYSMAPPQEEQQPRDVLLNENLLLAWSIVLSSLCSICGIVGLVKSIKARKAPWQEKMRLLNSAKIWLIVGTALHALAYFGGLF